ncbi:MAG: GNAT family N-acetyltransferase [Paludibacteraceae bacterium]
MNADKNEIVVQVADETHLPYVETILKTIANAAKVRGTGIARRTPEYIEQKMKEGKAIIALKGDKFAGFCYIETWGNKKFVANSGLIVVEKYRGNGLAKKIKQNAFHLSRERYPNAKIFGLTTGLAVMKINSELGYKPVTFSELTDDNAFWKGCESCVNYDILQRTNRKHCLCTGMLFDPAWQNEKEEEISASKADNNQSLVKKVVKKVVRKVISSK